MQFRTLHITLLSGNNLKKVVRPSRNMDVYAVVSISNVTDGSKQEHTTPSDNNGGANPTWNFLMEFKVGEAALQTSRLALEFKLLCKGTPGGGDRDVGRLSVLIKELLDSANNNTQFVGRVEHEGELTFSYKFSEISPAPAAAAASSSRPPLPSGAEVMEGVKKSVSYGAEVLGKNVKAVLESEALKNSKAALADLVSSSLTKKKDEGKFPSSPADFPARARPRPSRQASTSRTEGTSSFYEALKTTTSNLISSSVSSMTQPGSSKESGKTKPKPRK